MECLEFRRRLLIDPLCKEVDLLGHEEHCDECATFARDLRRKEIRLRALMRSIEPDPSLQAEIEEKTTAQPALATPPSHYGATMAMALLVATAIVWWVLRAGSLGGLDPAARMVLQHVEHEASHLTPGPAVSRNTLQYLFNRFGAQLSGELGEVYFAAECMMSKDTGIHLVLQGENGPVTMLMMPGENLSADVAIASTDWRGRVTPTPWGSVAVVGRAGEPTDQWTRRLLDSIRWPADGLGQSGLAAR